MSNKSVYALITVLLVSSSLFAKPGQDKQKKGQPSKKMSYQEAKKVCLNEDPGLLKEELKYCIKQQRSKNKKMKEKRG